MRADSSAIRSILDFVRDEDEFEEIDRLFEQIPDKVFMAIVGSTSSDERKAEPQPLTYSLWCAGPLIIMRRDFRHLSFLCKNYARECVQNQ